MYAALLRLHRHTGGSEDARDRRQHHIDSSRGVSNAITDIQDFCLYLYEHSERQHSYSHAPNLPFHIQVQNFFTIQPKSVFLLWRPAHVHAFHSWSLSSILHWSKMPRSKRCDKTRERKVSLESRTMAAAGIAIQSRPRSPVFVPGCGMNSISAVELGRCPSTCRPGGLVMGSRLDPAMDWEILFIAPTFWLIEQHENTRLAALTSGEVVMLNTR
jgi:hypothetical protein